jgi:Beta-ketoacyl synthase, N-terminal domain
LKAVLVSAWAVWTPSGVWVNASPQPEPAGGKLAPWPEAPRLAGIHPGARRPHRQAVTLVQLAHRLLVARAAVGKTSPDLVPSETDLLIGTALGSAEADAEFAQGLVERGSGFGSPSTFVYTLPTAAPAEVALALGLRGALATVSAGSISGLFAIARAATHVAEGRANACITGGVELGLPGGSVLPPAEGELAALFLLEPETASAQGPILSDAAVGFDVEFPGRQPAHRDSPMSTLLALAAACGDSAKRTAVEITGHSEDGGWARVRVRSPGRG